MRRFLSVLLSVFVIVTVCAAMCSADAASDFVRSLTPEQRELFLKALSEGSDEDTNHPVPSGVDPALKNGVKSGDIITGGNSDSPAPAPQLSNGQAWLEGAQRQGSYKSHTSARRRLSAQEESTCAHPDESPGRLHGSL